MRVSDRVTEKDPYLRIISHQSAYTGLYDDVYQHRAICLIASEPERVEPFCMGDELKKLLLSYRPKRQRSALGIALERIPSKHPMT
jgi:hypothetical protein